MSEYIAKASIEPRDYRVVFLIQKGGPQCEPPQPKIIFLLIQQPIQNIDLFNSLVRS